MRNKIVLIVFFLVLVTIFCDNKVNASFWDNDSLQGDTYISENIFIFDSQTKNLSYGRYYEGEYILYYLDNNVIETEYVEWFIFDYSLNMVIISGDDSSNNPWSSCNYSYVYKLIEFDYLNEVYVYGIVDTGYNGILFDNNQVIYVNYLNTNYLYNLCSNHPRNYNSSETIINNNTITTSVNIDNDYFFSNLSTNFGYNQYGSCGFVAIASLLTYYDFFINDDFINDSSTYSNDYCGNYSFIKYVTTSSDFSTSDFSVSPGYRDSFHYYLIDEIAINKLEKVFPMVGNYPSYGINPYIGKQIIDKYIEDVATSILSTDYSVTVLTTEADIKAALDLHRPVVLSVNHYEYEDLDGLHTILSMGHEVIAYGYKELSNGETIYRCHMGWFGESHTISSTTDILVNELIGSAKVLTITYTGSTDNCNDNVYLFNHSDSPCFGICHKHSGRDYYLDKVIYNSSYDYYYCKVCNNYVFHVPHVHEKSYTWYNLYNHYVTCPCGYSGYESHVVGTGPYISGYYKCLYCHGFMDGGIIHNKINPPYNPACHE